MPNEVTPTQDDHALAESILSEGRGYAVTFNKGHSTAVAVAAHRIAHEAPLLARIAELEGLLREMISDLKIIRRAIEESKPRALLLTRLHDIFEAAALAPTKDTPSHD